MEGCLGVTSATGKLRTESNIVLILQFCILPLQDGRVATHFVPISQYNASLMQFTVVHSTTEQVTTALLYSVQHTWKGLV